MPPTSERWKDMSHAPKILWSQIAANDPTRGIAVSNHSGVSCLYAWDVPTGALRPLREESAPRVFALLSPNGRHVYYMRDTKGNEIGHYVRIPYEGGLEEDLTPQMPLYSSSTIPFPLPMIAMSAQGNRVALILSDSSGFSLCTVSVAEDGTLGKPHILLSGRPLLRGPVLSTEGNIAVVCTNERTGKQQYDLKALDPLGNVIGSCTDSETGSSEAIAFAPLLGDQRLLFSSNRTGVKRPMLWNLSTESVTELLPPDAPSGEMVPLNWSTDGCSVLLCGFADAAQQLYRFDIETALLTPLFHESGTFTFFGCLGTYFGPGGNEVYAQMSSVERPPQVVAITANAPVRPILSGGSAPAGQPVRSVSFPSSDGERIQAWLSVPPGDGPFPTVVEVHGGPHGVTTAAYGLGAAWVGNGFAFLSVNYRGSTTFGREFQQKIWGDCGHWELEDIAAARDFLLQKRIAVPDKIVLTGGSYGGYLTLLALGKQPDLWTGGVALIAIADYIRTYDESSPLLQGITAALFAGTPEEKPDQYRISSPITYAEQVRAPLLVIQGRNDTRCPAGQMEVYEEKMRSLGKQIEVIWFDAGHGGGGIEDTIRNTERIVLFAKGLVS